MLWLTERSSFLREPGFAENTGERTQLVVNQIETGRKVDAGEPVVIA